MLHKSALILFITSFLLSACGPGQLFGPTLTPIPTITPTSTSTPTPTATFTPTLTLTPSATFTHTSSPTPIVYDGNWKGETSSGGRISFEVIENGVSSFQVSFYLTIKNGSCDVSMNTSMSPHLDITDGQFNIGAPDIKVAGTFDSPSTASGTVEATANNARCNGGISLTWTAER